MPVSPSESDIWHHCPYKLHCVFEMQTYFLFLLLSNLLSNLLSAPIPFPTKRVTKVAAILG